LFIAVIYGCKSRVIVWKVARSRHVGFFKSLLMLCVVKTIKLADTHSSRELPTIMMFQCSKTRERSLPLTRKLRSHEVA